MNATIVVWAIRIICGLAFIILLTKSFSSEHDGRKDGKDIDYTNIFTMLVLITIVYFSSVVDVSQEEELMSSAEIIHSILSSLPGFLVAFGVFYFMRIKQKSVYREAYYKGQEDYSKMIPEREAHLEKQTKEYEEAFNKGLKYRGEPLKRAYYKGVIDGYQICEGTYPQQSYEFDKYINIISKPGFDEEQLLNPLYSDWRNHIIDRYSLSGNNQNVKTAAIEDSSTSDSKTQSSRDAAIKNKKRMQYAYEQGLYDGFHYPYEVKGVEVPDAVYELCKNMYRDCHLDYARVFNREKSEEIDD